MKGEDMTPATPGSETATLLPSWPLYGMAFASERMVGQQTLLGHELLDVHQQVFVRWCQRRHETVEAAAALSRAPLADGSPETLAESWATWWLGAAQRLAADADDQAEFLSVVIRCCSGTAGWGAHDDVPDPPAPADETSGRLTSRRAAS